MGFTTQNSAEMLAGQPLDERAAQDALPKSRDKMWDLLTTSKIHVDEEKGLYSAIHSDKVRALINKEMTISGFMLPLEATEEFRHFILSKRTPTCGFCPPGEPNEIIEVWLDKPTKWSEDIVTISGKFSLMNNQELGMFFKLKSARLN